MPRDKLDRYYTPDPVARACVSTLTDRWLGSTVLEPSAGGGAFVRALRARPTVTWVWGMDVDESATGLKDATYGIPRDFLDFCKGQPQSALHSIVGNPPYRSAEAHLRHALSITPRVAFLLRLAFLEGQRRGRGLWLEHPPSLVYVLSKRPSFTAGGTDATAYGWFVWGENRPAGPLLRWLPEVE